MNNLIAQFTKHIPETKIKDAIKLIFYDVNRKSMLTELINIPVVRSGCERIIDRETPYVVLDDGTTLYGRWPSSFERQLFRRWKDRINPNITEDAIRVSFDVIMRYLYPHAMPHITMPYSRSNRRGFHPQHIETIEDLPHLTPAEKGQLKQMFTPKPGESFLDIGAYMGYGSIRMSRELGDTSSIIAVEADPDTLWLLNENLRRNQIENVEVIPKAIWHKPGDTLDFYKTDRQANSVITDIVSSTAKVAVQTTTVDEIIHMRGKEQVDHISLTVNGAEVEAVEGMKRTLSAMSKVRISAAGWYTRNGQRICHIISPRLKDLNFNIAVGKAGGVFAWK